MANSVGNGIKVAFEAIKLIFTRWYSYFIIALWAAAVFVFGWLLRFLLNTAINANIVPGIKTKVFEGGATYAMATDDSLMTKYLFGVSDNWKFAVALAASFCTLAACIVFIRALLDEHEQRSITWKSIIFDFLKYAGYIAPLIILWRLIIISSHGIISVRALGPVLVITALLVVFSALTEFYIVQAVATRKIMIDFSRFFNFIKSNIFNYLGCWFIYFIVGLIISVLSIYIFSMRYGGSDEFMEKIVGLAAPSLFDIVARILMLLFTYAAITLMYLRTPKESYDQYNR